MNTGAATRHPWGIRAMQHWPLVFLAFLIPPIRTSLERGTIRGYTDAAALISFGVLYAVLVSTMVASLDRAEEVPQARVRVLLAAMVSFDLGLWAYGSHAWTQTLAFVSVGLAIALPLRAAGPAIAALGLLTLVVTREPSFALIVMVSGGGTAAGMQGARRAREAHAARAANTHLAMQEERNRMARDLHDILGHSLTVITVKAELARRLLDVDPDRARAELTELEGLSRSALADVRRTVTEYREISLAAELVGARQALTAAGIEAQVPGAVDDVAPDLRELFAWCVREAVTNVIRHSRARRCTIRLSPTTLEIRDDGTAPLGPPGNGLTGLQERAQTVGAVVTCDGLAEGGHLLRATVRSEEGST